MIGRIVEVADDQRHLFLHRGFMVVKDTAGERRELGQIPLDDIAAVIANAHGLSYTNNLLVALVERCAPFVLCGANHNAVGMLLPIDGNYQQAKRFDAQIEASKPTNKRLWADIVRSKLQQQAAALEAAGAPVAPCRHWCPKYDRATRTIWKRKVRAVIGGCCSAKPSGAIRMEMASMLCSTMATPCCVRRQHAQSLPPACIRLSRCITATRTMPCG